MRSQSSLALAFLFLFALELPSDVSARENPSPDAGATRIETSAGVVQGKLQAGAVTFLGIPFAKPPVGELRWQPPQPAEPWRGTLDATKFGKHCLDAMLDASQSDASEDCLFLNVYVPGKHAAGKAGGTKPLPVMVWIYGGGNLSGASEYYDPTPLVTTGDGVVVVTVNYRVGAFGFFAHPALDNEGDPAVNYGVMDQQLALKWVQKNIGRFGGDAKNVTIFGESAGGLNVTTHLVSPLSAGLFHRAIIQSGGYLLDTPSLSASQERGIGFAKRVGCTEQAAACLRGLSVAKVLDNADTLKPTRAFDFATVDGRVILQPQRAALAAGKINRVPVMVGNTRDEGLLFLARNLSMEDHKKILDLLEPEYNKDPARALEIYSLQNYPSAYEAGSAAHGDQRFACSAQQSSRLLAKWVPVYTYEFADETASKFRATHGTELKYLFNVEFGPDLLEGDWEHAWVALTGRPDALPVESQRLALAMRTSWISFATTGNPRSSLLPNWPAASAGIQLLKPGAPEVLKHEAFRSQHHCEFWD